VLRPQAAAEGKVKGGPPVKAARLSTCAIWRLLRLRKHAVELGAADGADALRHATAVGLNDVTFRGAGLFALHAVEIALVLVTHELLPSSSTGQMCPVQKARGPMKSRVEREADITAEAGRTCRNALGRGFWARFARICV